MGSAGSAKGVTQGLTSSLKSFHSSLLSWAWRCTLMACDHCRSTLLQISTRPRSCIGDCTMAACGCRSHNVCGFRTRRVCHLFIYVGFLNTAMCVRCPLQAGAALTHSRPSGPRSAHCTLALADAESCSLHVVKYGHEGHARNTQIWQQLCRSLDGTRLVTPRQCRIAAGFADASPLTVFED